MMARLLRFALALPLLGIAACGHSPSTTLLTLDAAAPPPAAVRADYRGLPLAVPAVHLPAAIDRQDYVSEVAPGQAKVEDFAQWVAPLGTLARDTLVRDLIARLPQGSVLPPGATGGPGTRTLDVTILSFSASGGEGRMEAVYREVPHGPVRQVALHATAPAGGPVAGAQLLGLLLGQLADGIVAGLPPR